MFLSFLETTPIKSQYPLHHLAFIFHLYVVCVTKVTDSLIHQYSSLRNNNFCKCLEAPVTKTPSALNSALLEKFVIVILH